MTLVFKSEQVLSSLAAKPYFATLINENKDFFTFELAFKIKQSEIVLQSLAFLKIFAKNPLLVNFNPQDPPQDPNLKDAIDKITAALEAKNQIKAEEAAIIAFAEINLYQYVDSEVRALLLAGTIPENIKALYDFKDVLESNQRAVERLPSGINPLSTRNLNLELLSRYGIDPAGILRISDGTNKTVDDLKKYYVNEVLASQATEGQYFGLAKKVVYCDEIDIKTTINLPKDLASGKIDFEVNLHKENRSDPAQSIALSVDVDKYKKYFKPTIENTPVISYADGRLNVQQASKTGKISIVKKQIDGFGNGSEYTNFGSGELDSTQSFSVYVPESTGKLEVYRCFNGDAKSNFSSVVVGGNLLLDTTGLSIMDAPEKNAIKLQVSSPPNYAELIQIEKNCYNALGSQIKSTITVLPFSDVSFNRTVFDTSVNSGEIYEYLVKYTTRGSIIDSISRTHKHVINSKNIPLAATITEQIVSFDNDEPSVSFTIRGSIDKNDQDKITAALKAYDVYDQFAEEIKKAKEDFSSLLFLKVERVNLKTGQRDFFDIQSLSTADEQGIFSLTFTDNLEIRKKLAIPTLDLRVNYLYQVRAFFKNPLTLLKDYVKSGLTKFNKSYAYRPYRFFQENSLQGTLPAETNDGNIVDFESLIEQGDIGIIASTTINGASVLAQLQFVTAERIDANKIRVAWSPRGLAKNYDHFIIVKEINKNRKILAISTTNEYVDYFSKQDSGTVIYYVIPVLSDYSIASASRSNATIVDPNEF